MGAEIDDFGTGYSSLTFLRHFAGNTLKIDRSFIASICDDEGSAEIVRTIVDLAGNLDLGVIAEGVETEAQRQTCSTSASATPRDSSSRGPSQPLGSSRCLPPACPRRPGSRPLPSSRSSLS